MKRNIMHTSLRKGLLLSLMVMGLIWAGAGCDGQQSSATSTGEATGEIVQIDVDKFKTMLDEKQDVVVLDVRTPEEWAQGTVAGSQKINYKGDNFEAELEKLDKSKEYVVYCAVGGRSGKACEEMQDMGFTKVYNVQGGMNGWKARGYPTE